MSKPTPLEGEDELRRTIRKTLQAGNKNMWRSPNHDQYPQENYEDDLVEAISAYTSTKEREAELKAYIEEIEDIDQSRDVEEDAAGYWWCTSCEMSLEDPEQQCGCNHIYEKRKQRVAKLKAELAHLNAKENTHE